MRLLIVLLLVAAGVVHADVSDRIDAVVRAEMTRQRIPGVAVAVVHEGKVVKLQGYGYANVEHAVPVTPDTIFQSGSIGKQFTSTLVMLLVEDGNWDWGEPFVVLGLAGWALVVAVAFGYVVREMGKAGARMAAEGPSPELAGRIGTLVLIARVLIVVLVAIVFVMVVKPGT